MKQESTQATSVNALNRAKMYQLVLFPMNNGATNVYYILTMNFIAYYANGVLGLLLAFATTMVTLMRAGDAFIDPIIGAIMDRTSTKWGKFRPFMVIGNLIMIAVACFFLYLAIRHGFEPLLLVPIAFGMLLVNIYPDIMLHAEDSANGTGGLLYYFYVLDEWSILPSLIFLGVGAMTDFGPLIANPKSFLLGAADRKSVV